MKTLISFIALTLFSLTSNAVTGSLDVFNCTIENNQTGDISNERLQLENDDTLYAQAFKGDTAKGTGGIKAEENSKEKLFFVKPEASGATTILLSSLNSNKNQTLTNYSYLELFTPDVTKVHMRTGYCIRYNVN